VIIRGAPLTGDPGRGDILVLKYGKIVHFPADEPAPPVCADGMQIVTSPPGGPVAASSKPPYRVPTMAEIEAVEPSGFTAASSFSGCGGSCLGYRMAGFSVGWASEFVPAAADTYRANHPGTVLDTRDIREVTPEEILTALSLSVGELDLWDGSPPCASFSTAGKRHEHWGLVRKYSDTAQRTDDLFFEYARLLAGLQPRTFIAENVTGLVKGVAKGYFIQILRALRGCGYRVEARALDASWLGVPQARKRIIFAGVREDLGMPPVFPKPLPYQYTVRDALPWVTAQGDNAGFGGGAYQDSDRPSPTIGTHPYSGNGRFPPSQVAVVHDTSGERGQGNVTDMPAPTITPGRDGMNSHHFQVRRVIHDTGGQPQYSMGDITDRTAATVMETPGHFKVAQQGGELVTADPETGEDITVGRYAIGKQWELLRPDAGLPGGQWAECRKLTLGELRALSGFPADFELTGSYAQRWERIGRAVPPVMMAAIGEAVRDGVLLPLREAGRI
jgi:DNA (cytosine-5)-methyltransferase 1